MSGPSPSTPAPPSWTAAVAGTLVAALAVGALVWLGTWQWQRSRPDVLVARLPVVEVSEVLAGAEPLLTRDQGRRVRAAGTWRPERQLLVAGRRRPPGEPGGDPGEAGRWVVTPLEVEGGRLLPVVRGWVPAGTGDGTAPTAVPAPEGAAVVEGWVQASEPLDVRVAVVQPPGVVALLAGADLLNRWPEPVTDGFVVADVPAGPAAAGVAAALPGPVEAARGTRDWRNVAYAAQWWVFAAFAAVIWWRSVAWPRAVPRAARRPPAAAGGEG